MGSREERPLVMMRGDIAWADSPDPEGSAPGFRRPVLILQSDLVNQTFISTVVVVALTTNMKRLKSPGSVLVSAKESGLPQDAVVHVTQIMTIDKNALDPPIGRLSARKL